MIKSDAVSLEEMIIYVKLWKARNAIENSLVAPEEKAWAIRSINVQISFCVYNFNLEQLETLIRFWDIKTAELRRRARSLEARNNKRIISGSFNAAGLGLLGQR